MPRFLEQRRRRWYAVLDVPLEARKFIGKRRLVKSLETDSLAQAQIRVLGVVQLWKEQIAKIKLQAAGVDANSPEGIQPDAWRLEMMRLKALGAEDWEVDHALRDLAEDLAEDGDGDAYASYSVAAGKSVLLPEHLEGYLEDEVPDPKSKDMKTRHLSFFFKRFTLAEDVNQESVAEWVEEVLLSELRVSHKTAKTYLSTYRTFWRYLSHPVR